MYNSPRLLLKGIKADFYNLLATAPDFQFKNITSVTKSDSDKEDYLIPDAFPYVKEWIDQIDFKLVKDYLFTIRNKDWTGGAIKVKKTTLDDSRKTLGGDVQMKVEQTVADWADFPSSLVQTLLDGAAVSGTAFDGSAFFATSHNIDGASAIDNLKTGSGTTLAQVTTDFATAKNALLGYRDKNNRVINNRPKLVVLCPSHMEDTFLTLRNSMNIYDGAVNKTNIYYNTFDIVVNYQQSISVNDWYLINSAAPFKPFILQQRTAPEWNFTDEPKNLYYEFFSTSRFNVGYGNFTAICKVDN